MTQDVTTSSSPEDTGGQTAGVSEEELYPQFSEPDKNLTTKPLWFWNTDLDSMTTDQVREIVRESYLQSGYTGFGILPYWMDDYMSEKYFELYEAALDEGVEIGIVQIKPRKCGTKHRIAGLIHGAVIHFPRGKARRFQLALGQ